MKAAWLPSRCREGLRYSCSNQSIFSCPSVQPHFRPFSLSTNLHAGIAAPEIQFGKGKEGIQQLEKVDEALFLARVIPKSRSYFTTAPIFTDSYLKIQELGRKYGRLPHDDAKDRRHVAWPRTSQYKQSVGERFRSSKYRQMIETLRRLDKIHPAVMPTEVKAVLSRYRRDFGSKQKLERVIRTDELGRAVGAGRRKSSTARAWVVEGTGEILINGKTLPEAFGRIHDRESAIWALKATDRLNKYNVWASVSGGGTTGQAEALTLAIANALVGHEPALKMSLRTAGCIRRDPRRVERKKPGHVKARKKPAWVKR